MQQSYEVIRFVGQNGKFHIVMDYVEGELLSSFIQSEESMSKKLFFRLMSEVAKELEGLERSNATEYVPCLTPFHIVIKEDQSVAFLKYNEKYHKKLEKVVDQFIPSDGSNNYFYSYGRVLQFVLMKVRLRPRLTKMEEFKIKRIISKCMETNSKRQFKDVRELLSKLKTVKNRKGIFAIVALFFGASLLASTFLERKEIQELENEDPYLQLQAYMSGDNVESDIEIEMMLRRYEEEKGDTLGLAEREWIMDVCYRLNTEYARQQLKVHSEVLFNEVVSKRELLANLYERAGEIQQAANEYQVLVVESPTAERYLVFSRLLEQCGMNEKALDECKTGCELFPERQDLQLQYVKLLMLDQNCVEQEKLDKLSQFLEIYPNLEKSEAFIRLKQELVILEEPYNE